MIHIGVYSDHDTRFYIVYVSSESPDSANFDNNSMTVLTTTDPVRAKTQANILRNILHNGVTDEEGMDLVMMDM